MHWQSCTSHPADTTRWTSSRRRCPLRASPGPEGNLIWRTIAPPPGSHSAQPTRLAQQRPGGGGFRSSVRRPARAQHPGACRRCEGVGWEPAQPPSAEGKVSAGRRSETLRGPSAPPTLCAAEATLPNSPPRQDAAGSPAPPTPAAREAGQLGASATVPLPPPPSLRPPTRRRCRSRVRPLEHFAAPGLAHSDKPTMLA